MKLRPTSAPHKAIDFLRLMHPEGPWVLTSIAPDRKGTTTSTFTPSQEEDVRAWLDRYDGQRNIYWSVNLPLRSLDKKAERQDIKSVIFLHVDIDARAGEDLEQERSRILALLDENLPIGVPPPTAVVSSGGGAQAFWRLENPIPIDGDLGAAEEAKRFNIQLELLFGADKCHNIDRIMRLPGTINLPDARKRKKGRVKALAELVHFEEARLYPLTAFAPAPAQPTRTLSPALLAKSVKGQTPGGGMRLKSVDELDKWGVSDRIKVVIVQGHDPGNPKKGDNSRSAWVFDVCCHLHRDGVPDEVVFAILTDPDFGISASILEKGLNAEKYALRQIERAKIEGASPELHELNCKHAVLECENGKARVLSWVEGDDGRPRLALQSFEDFRNRYLNRRVIVGQDEKGKPIELPLGPWWLKHEHRRQYIATVFRPGADDVIGDYLNLWQGWGVEPKEGAWPALRAHIEEVLANDVPEHGTYIINFAAWCVQNPDSRPEVALVLRGARGTGKGLFARVLNAIFGRHGMQVTDPKHITGGFNAHLRDLCYLYADEAFAARDPKAEAVLKGLITEPEFVLEGKGKDAISVPNRLHIVMTSNTDWVAPAGPRERRFAVFDVSDNHIQDRAWFAAINAELEAGGLQAFLHYLLNYELGDWHPRNDIPQTQALQDQKELSLNAHQNWLLALIEEGRLPGDGTQPPHCALVRDLVRHAQQTVPELRLVHPRGITSELRKWGCQQFHNGKDRGWRFPPLQKLMREWEGFMGGWTWDEAQPTEWNGSQTEDPYPF